MGKRIPTVNYSLTKEIGTYILNAANGLTLVEFKFMTTSVLTGAESKQIIKININQTKNNFITSCEEPTTQGLSTWLFEIERTVVFEQSSHLFG